MVSFEQEVISGNFVKAKHLSLNMDIDSLRDSLFLIAYDNENLTPYGFVNYLLFENETAQLHYLASFLLSMALNHLDGAYQTAFFHATRASELEPNDISYMEDLLFFYGIPDQLLSKRRANDIAMQILKKDPDNKVASSVLEGN
ncbi:hypothetical protein [Peribacillus simplex]|uniref:hypothetical protein n=1 Tax=Peribacillus simplex TaxID=1478 RepID=UPI003D2BD83C